MRIDPNSHVPIYLQIADYIREAIAAGVYRPKETLPSLRTLALELVVNPNTVQRAYEELEREHLVRSRKGVGLFVAGEAAESARAKSQAAVREHFVRGIRAGQAARLSPERIRAAFEKAWRDLHAEAEQRT